ncbi:carboxymuconolactone decarboxylase family protein [Streptacidiphilus pinicola]|uniref:Carboxymuconolactone decarboxylase family protein n=1 Tax=Streptacidiphilus pinicola TaxID=2219663 RepID=A0A2X0IGK5_9ACTN|nr:carboxymuconolactone decarboxylase family protein [Streptacidiphilus pinicola]RAG82753.1 carboxymuconolactone decarboxylase family protein [Streptacidiphilus pinicola]
MDARLDFFAAPVSGKALKYFMSAGKVIKEAGLPAELQELVSTRVSQINGCAVCLDMHAKEAVAAGVGPVKLALVAAWREATVFSEAERAALALAEEGTRVADAAEGVGDEVWAKAAAHFDTDQLTALVIHIAFMNMVNRMNIITRQPCAGDYVAGQLH